jgi:exodeoxyribonuclease V gamma subunit
MPGVYLHTGNRLEILADTFTQILAQAPLPPFEPETILVQSKGMARWLAMQTAKRLNIWANCDCPFPNTFINKIFRTALPGVPDSASYDRETITFHLMDLLPELANEPGFETVNGYLENGRDLNLYQLAIEIADLFDQYAIYRPDMILAWESNNNPSVHEHIWQSQVWLRLIDRLHKTDQNLGPHRAKLFEKLLETLSAEGFDPTRLPNRVSVFGISSLPPYHLKILATLSRYIELHFFIINPCQEFWSDIIVDRQIVRIRREKAIPEDLLHLQKGNSLLSSMGQLGRDMISMLQDIEYFEHEYFVDPGQDSLLSCIQQDILFLQEREVPLTSQTNDLSAHPGNKLTIAPDDTSIVFHSCHSNMREIETLHNHLLEIFNTRNNTIEPQDILVMAPSIEEYEPLIQAVFDAPTGSQAKIPYTVADRKIRHTSNYINTFLNFLSLSNSRLNNVDVISLLESEPVQHRFQITDNDIVKIKDWITATNIRWGIDKDHKQRLHLPPYQQNTWRAGLDRLQLGYAMQGNDQHIFKEILPYDNIEGEDTLLLGEFLDFIETLIQQIHVLEQNHTLEAWSEILLQLKEKFLFADNESEPESQLLEQLFHQMSQLQHRTSFIAPVALDVIQSYLLKAIDQQGEKHFGATGFLAGGITFCEMLPMRAIPFKIICLLGMNDGSYPRPSRSKSFDLMFHEPRRGDRSRRLDDRYLFLETLLSARQQLYISYVGQSVKDNSCRPPSVLVNELMDYIDQGYCIDQPACHDTGTILEKLTTRHHLQPFHPEYFKPTEKNRDSRLFSYSRENLEAAAVLSSAQKKPVQPLLQHPLPTASDEFRNIELHHLCNFFLNPAKFFLTRRLGIGFVEQLQEINTNEPFSLSGLERYHLENDLLRKKLAGKLITDEITVKKAAGELPHGRMAETIYEEIVSDVEEFALKLTQLSIGTKMPTMDIDIELVDFKIFGQLENIYENGMIRYRCTAIKPKDIITAWIHHLFFQLITDRLAKKYDTVTYLAGKDITYKYQPVPAYTIYLQELLSLYWRGLAEPLYFFPQTSYAYAKEIFNGRNKDKALKKAGMGWNGNDFVKGEKADPYLNLCFKDTIPFNQQFFELANDFFLPLFQHLKKHTD